jgi:hypothetical protein
VLGLQHLGTLGLTKERLDFPSLVTAFRCPRHRLPLHFEMRRRLRGKENRVGSKRWGVALRVGIQRPHTVWLGRVASLAKIAEREGRGERHIRLLAPLAFLSPRLIAVIVDGTAAADLTVAGLAKALPYSWAEQEHKIPLHSQ